MIHSPPQTRRRSSAGAPGAPAALRREVDRSRVLGEAGEESVGVTAGLAGGLAGPELEEIDRAGGGEEGVGDRAGALRLVGRDQLAADLGDEEVAVRKAL